VIERRRASATREETAEHRTVEGRLASLEARADHLESLVEGLQDAIHRDSVRHGREMEGLRRATDPSKVTRRSDDE
jgi:hypothetical protein